MTRYDIYELKKKEKMRVVSMEYNNARFFEF